MAVSLPDVPEHPNRAAFEGVLTLVDVASTRPPSGARGHRVILTRAAALSALPSLLGMGVGFKQEWDGHDARRKCGVITEADIEGNELKVSGYLYAKDFPEVARYLRTALAGTMGMSYELANAHVEDMRADVWRLSRATFTGAAILLREKAAYRDTRFALKPQLCRKLAAKERLKVSGEMTERRLNRRKSEAKSGEKTQWNCRTY